MPQQTPGDGEPTEPRVSQAPLSEFTDDAPTPPSGLSLEARDWQLTDDEDVQQMDFNRFRSDR